MRSTRAVVDRDFLLMCKNLKSCQHGGERAKYALPRRVSMMVLLWMPGEQKSRLSTPREARKPPSPAALARPSMLPTIPTVAADIAARELSSTADGAWSLFAACTNENMLLLSLMFVASGFSPFAGRRQIFFGLLREFYRGPSRPPTLAAAKNPDHHPHPLRLPPCC